MVKAAVFAVPPAEAVIVALVDVLTALVAIVKVPVDLPVAIVRVLETVADVLSLESEITRPPTGAGPVKITVPTEFFPPLTVVGFKVSESTVGGMTMRTELAAFELKVPVTVTAV